MKSKSLVNCFAWTHRDFEKLAIKKKKKKKIGGGGGGGWEFYYRFMYNCTVPSSDHSNLLDLNLPFQVILRRFKGV